MALTAKQVYALSKKYTDDEVAGGGAIKGKNCIVKSLTAITGGHRVTFEWTLDNGTVQSDYIDVMDGADGADGAPGTPGANGKDGKDGLTPTITVDPITGGHEVTITIGTGTPIVFDVMDGVDGSQGPAGVGVPTGGTVGQVLKKKSGTNYDTEWADESGGGTGHGIPSGGTSGQILSKNSNTDYDAKWIDPAAYSQEQSDFGENDNTKVSFIKNKPTKLSDFSNDENFIDNTVDNLTNYYKNTETYTQAEVNNLISAIVTLNIEVVASLPTTDISETTIYFVPKSTPGTNNVYDEWICTDKDVPTWEKIGDTQIDLSGYALKSEMSVTDGTGADADKTTIQLKSGTSAKVLKSHQDISGKQNSITISGKKVNI